MTEPTPQQPVPHDPFHDPTQEVGPNHIRRLFLVDFSCPLCGNEHGCQVYLTLATSDEEHAMQLAVNTLNNDDVKLKTLTPFLKEFHLKQGDYLRLARNYVSHQARFPFTVNRIAMTSEDSYTCDLCNMKFETIGAYRTHSGRNPRDGSTLPGLAGVPVCARA